MKKINGRTFEKQNACESFQTGQRFWLDNVPSKYTKSPM
jgi:hypothetical protein